MAIKQLVSEIGFNDGEVGWILTYGLGTIEAETTTAAKRQAILEYWRHTFMPVVFNLPDGTSGVDPDDRYILLGLYQFDAAVASGGAGGYIRRRRRRW